MSERSAPAPFPWADAAALAFGRLGWTPDAFWNATPRDLALAADGIAALSRPAIAAPDRAALDALMRSHPDRGAMQGD